MNEPAAVAPLPDVRTGPHDHQRQGILKLAVGAIGIVFGDIGTSPIYAFRETFAGHHPIAPDPLHIHGVLSLIFWSMMIVVTIKYVVVIMRADNKGEGGSLALLALISREIPRAPMDGRDRAARRVRLRAFLRRQHDNARHLGAFGGRGAADRRATVRPLRCAHRSDHPDRAFLDPVPWHAPRRDASSARSCCFISRQSRCSGSCTSPATRRSFSTP